MTAQSGAKGGSGDARVHVPVLLDETVAALDLRPGLVVVDGTTGAGGHGQVIAGMIGAQGLLLCLDRDAEILARSRAALTNAAGVRARIRHFHLEYSRIRQALAAEGLHHCDRVLLDLGVSSMQLDDAERGFSFMSDGPLDMRMDRGSGPTAAAWLRQASETEIARVLAEYGEEPAARRIAAAIVARRQRGPLQRTGDLVAVVLESKRGAHHGRVHPATRTFQAIRIAVNRELEELAAGLREAEACLVAGGRLAVISFHSLEDRIVKNFLRASMLPTFKKPVTASAQEIAMNPRARSAKLRCGIKRAA